jgi:hypothetical protein
MTAQIAEMLHYEGEWHSMCTTPLDDYFTLNGIAPTFAYNCSALWRGYVGRWEIVDGRLYLRELHGLLDDGREASLASVFPDHPYRVFAHWFSGTLRIPQGARLQYVHMGFGSTYERDLLLEIERGILMKAHVRHHGVASSGEAPSGYQIGALTVFPREPRRGEDAG